MAAPKGVPRTPQQKRKISISHQRLARERMTGLMYLLLEHSRDGRLSSRINREVEQAARDFARDGEIQNNERAQLIRVLARYI